MADTYISLSSELLFFPARMDLQWIASPGPAMDDRALYTILCSVHGYLS